MKPNNLIYGILVVSNVSVVVQKFPNFRSTFLIRISKPNFLNERDLPLLKLIVVNNGKT